MGQQHLPTRGSAPDCRVVLDTDCTITAINAAAVAWLGLGPKKVIGRSFWDFVAPTAPCGDLIKQAMAEGRPMRAELRSSVRPDRWLTYHVNRTKQGVVVAFRDITEDVVSRDFPEEGLALLQTTIDALSAHVAVLDNEGVIRVVNRAWRDFAKAGGLRDANGGLGSNYLEACRRAGPRVPGALAVMRRLKQVISGAASEARHLYACDTPRDLLWFQMRASALKLGGARWTLVVHENVTEVRRASEDRRELHARLLETAEEERRRIARELHDSTAQHLTAVGLQLARLRHSEDPTVRRAAEDEASASLREAQREIRTLSYLLHPPVAGPDAFLTIARRFVEGFETRTGLRASLQSIGKSVPPLSEDHAAALLRVLQEALMNVHRHARASKVDVRLRYDGAFVELEVRDDGSGIEITDWGTEAIVFGVGIPGMRARMQQYDGDLMIRRDRKGTILRAWLPVENAGGVTKRA
jgi:PAS domain S-box-containing protein